MCLLGLSSSGYSKIVSFVVAAAKNDKTTQNKEAKALMKWKLSLDNQSQHQLSSWVWVRYNNHCNWVGVAYDEYRSVTYLNLSSTNLNGTLQNLSFSSFPNIISINLAQNHLYGDIPLGLYNVSKVIDLDLSSNHLSKFLSPMVGSLSSVSTFHIGGNGLSGSIPHEIGKMKSWTVLDLQVNNLTGPIPASIGNLTNIVRLYLHFNSLSGHIPPEIGNLGN
nr:probable leucine-rich repeat receptor-like protein kinase At1g35710 [Ziziphus jujuba var. spinosa]